jgi:hypothetical protein
MGGFLLVSARRILLAGSALAAAFLLGTPAASASPEYPPSTDATLRVSATQIRVGDHVKVLGSGFTAARDANVIVALTCRGKTQVWGTLPVNTDGLATGNVELSKPCPWLIALIGADERGDVRALAAGVVARPGRLNQSHQSTSDGPAPAAAGKETPADLTFAWAGLGLVVTSGGLIGGLRARRRVRR